MIIAVDFDGTIIEDGRYPEARDSKPYAFTVLKWLKKCGFKLVLWTCRNGESLEKAVEFCKLNDLEFDAINTNIADWPHLSNKVAADFYIDDRAFPSPYPNGAVDWKFIGKQFGMKEIDFE